MDWISREVRALMDKHCTTDPFKLADYLGYELIPFYFSRIRGMILVIDNDTYIGYSTRLPRRLQSLVLLVQFLLLICSFPLLTLITTYICATYQVYLAPLYPQDAHRA